MLQQGTGFSKNDHSGIMVNCKPANQGPIQFPLRSAEKLPLTSVGVRSGPRFLAGIATVKDYKDMSTQQLGVCLPAWVGRLALIPLKK